MTVVARCPRCKHPIALLANGQTDHDLELCVSAQLKSAVAELEADSHVELALTA